MLSEIGSLTKNNNRNRNNRKILESPLKDVAIIGMGTMGKQIYTLLNAHDVRVSLFNRNRFADIDLSIYDWIIEAVSERLADKVSVLSSCSRRNSKCIITSNTSSFTISKLSDFVIDPDRFMGVHFMNPANVNQIVEVVRSPKTFDSTYEIILDELKFLEKTVVKSPDIPGFLVNRMLFPFINESIRLAEYGMSFLMIDLLTKNALKHPMGILSVADMIGLDVVLDILASLYEQTSNQAYKPPEVLKEMVKEGKLGRKTGMGFFKYD